MRRTSVAKIPLLALRQFGEAMPLKIESLLARAKSQDGTLRRAGPEYAQLAFDITNSADKLVALVKAAKMLSDSLESGFIVCQKCGDQEDTKNMDFADDVRNALAALTKRAEWREEGEG